MRGHDLPHLSKVRADERLCWIKSTSYDILDILLSHLLVMPQQVYRFRFLATFWFCLVDLLEQFSLFLGISFKEVFLVVYLVSGSSSVIGG